MNVAHILCSCRDYQGEPNEIYFKVLYINKIQDHAKVIIPSTYISLANLHLSRIKHNYILGCKDHPTKSYHPSCCRKLSSYTHAYF